MNRDLILFVVGLVIILSAAYTYADSTGPQFLTSCTPFGDCGDCSGYGKKTGAPTYGDITANSDTSNYRKTWGSGGCGGCGTVAAESSGETETVDMLEYTRQIVLNYYTKVYGDDEIDVLVEDYGCHVQADILKDGTVIKTLAIYGDRIYEY